MNINIYNDMNINNYFKLLYNIMKIILNIILNTCLVLNKNC